MMNINLRESIEGHLFASEADMTNVDVAASIDRYDEMVYAAVMEAYPDAIVTDRAIHPHAMGIATIWSDDEEIDEEYHAQRIWDISDRILQDGDWIVMREEVTA